MTEAKGPPVQLDFEKHWCARHLLPFKKDWPAGAPTAMIRLFQAVVEDPRFQRACGRDDGSGAVGQVSRINPLLSEFAPLCCFVGDEIMAAITTDALAQR